MELETKEPRTKKIIICSIIIACIIFSLIFTVVSAKSKDTATDTQTTEIISSEMNEIAERSARKKQETTTLPQPETTKKEPESTTASAPDEELQTTTASVAENTTEITTEKIEEIKEETKTTEAPEEKTTEQTTEAPTAAEEKKLAQVDDADAMDYTEDELFMLAVIIGQETAGDNEEIALAVGNVVLNRIADKRFPNNMYDVLTAPLQYGRESGNFYFNSYVTEEGRALCYRVARRLLNGERVLPANVVWQAGFPQGVGTYAYYDTEPYGLWLCY